MSHLISIVLPTFNGERYIKQSIDSILQQTYTDWELIVVNDCSSDGTLAIINEYANRDSRIRVINNATNLKLPASLNVGFSVCKGDYYTWTSDDNLYQSKAIERMVDILADDAIGMVYCDMKGIDALGNVISEDGQKDASELCNINCVGACFLYKASVAKEVGDYDKDLFLAEDYDYWIRISQKAEIKHLSETLYFYRLHDSSLTVTKAKDIKNQTTRLKLKYFDYWNERLGQAQFEKFITRMVHEATDESLNQVQKKVWENSRQYFPRIVTERMYRLFHETPIWNIAKNLPIIRSIRKETRSKVVI